MAEPSQSAGAPVDLEQTLARIPQNVTPQQIKGLNCTVLIRATGTPPQEWVLTFKDGTCTLNAGSIPSPDLVVEAAPDVWASLMRRQLDAGWAYMSGQLRVIGDLGLAMRLQSVLGLG